MKQQISVVIATKDRPRQLKNCLRTIFKSDTNFLSQLIIVDQSQDGLSQQVVAQLVKQHSRFKKIVDYFSLKEAGLSKARNWGIDQSRGEIIAFTDDDCLVDSEWINRIEWCLSQYPEVAGVTGNTYPYQPKSHPQELSPCTFIKPSILLNTPTYHADQIGYGNNMAFRRDIFNKIGYFTEWLGVGSEGKSAEDAEFFLRLLDAGHLLFHDQEMIVYHHRWLDKQSFFSSQTYNQYLVGELACYSYYAVRGKLFAIKVVARNLVDFLCGLLNLPLATNMQQLKAKIRGIIWGTYHSLSNSH